MKILLKPLVTEKFTAQNDKLNKYGFIVEVAANKIEIKNEIEKMYGVNISSINTMKYAGKVKSRYTKTGFITGKTKAYKKAIVTLVDGDKIDFYSNI